MNDRLVSYIPVLTSLLLESANVSQLLRMWTERSAVGQSLWSWIFINVALWLWLTFYKVKTPDEHVAIWATRIGICLNSAVIMTVFYFRYVV